MNRRSVTALLAATASTAALAVPAPAAAASTILSATDEHDDVQIYAATDGLSQAERKSIDIYTFRVAEGAGNKIRFTVGIEEIIRKPKFDQMFFVGLKPPPKSDATWDGQIGFTSKGEFGYATVYDYESDESVWCDIDGVTRRPAKDKVSIDVPRRCLPGQKAKVRLDSYTGHFRSDAPPWSRDRLRVPGRHDLTP
jgi:hypothetical protein